MNDDRIYLLIRVKHHSRGYQCFFVLVPQQSGYNFFLSVAIHSYWPVSESEEWRIIAMNKIKLEFYRHLDMA